MWFSPGSPVSSTNKTDRNDITEISELKKIDETENHAVTKTLFLWSSEIEYYFSPAKKFSFVFKL